MKQKILIFLFLITSFSSVLYSQNFDDTLAVVTLRNVAYINSKTLEFEIHMQRYSWGWLKFANATFQLEFDNGYPFDVDNMNAFFDQESELKIQTQVGDDLPTDGYLFEPKIFKDRVSITILGPPDFDYCEKIPNDTTLLIGKFYLQSQTNDIPDKLRWKTPQNFYQHCAYKLEKDSLVDDYIIWYKEDDNVPLIGGPKGLFVMQDDSRRGYQFVHNDLFVNYAGRLDVDIKFNSLSEYRVDGYTIMRGYSFPGVPVNYTDTVATFKNGSQFFKEEMISKGNTRSGHQYGTIKDVVAYRGGEYAYSLYGHFTNSDEVYKDTLLDVATVEVPNAVIVEAKATPQNFEERTNITYKVEDDVYLTIEVYDLNGKFVKYLNVRSGGDIAKNSEVKKNVYETEFIAPELASQGLYRIIFTAIPIKDPNVEISRAYVDVQLLK